MTQKLARHVEEALGYALQDAQDIGRGEWLLDEGDEEFYLYYNDKQKTLTVKNVGRDQGKTYKVDIKVNLTLVK